MPGLEKSPQKYNSQIAKVFPTNADKMVNRGGFMACCEHYCTKCGHITFNNFFRCACENCGSPETLSTYDDEE